MIEFEDVFIDFFEAKDGEIFGMDHIDKESQEVIFCLLLKRDSALRMAKYILENFGEK